MTAEEEYNRLKYRHLLQNDIDSENNVFFRIVISLILLTKIKIG